MTICRVCMAGSPQSRAARSGAGSGSRMEPVDPDSDRREQHSAALLLRVWQEGADVRCRLLEVTDSLSPSTAVAHGVDAICDGVRRWLQEFQRPD
jgi:hypothetical protein